MCLHARDSHAVTLIYENYSAVLYNVILKVVRHEELAQDVLQDALVKVWRNSTKFDREKGSLFTWLVRICRNAAIDKMRSKDFQNTEKSRQSEDIVTIGDQPEQEEHLNRLYMKQMIDQLPENQRRLIDLSYFQGYTHKEIAENLGMPLGTVKTRIRLAIKHLRAII